MTETFGIIGVGAFGALAARHLAPHFDLMLHDTSDIAALAQNLGAKSGSLRDAASCDIVMLAVPVQKMRAVLADIAPLVTPGALIIDVGSVKLKPVAAMGELLPSHVSIVGTHPLFGPQSGKNGIAGLNIAVCDARGGRGESVARFCEEKLQLKTHRVTADEHDRQMAYVQVLTHMLGKVWGEMKLPVFQLTTKTYDLFAEAVSYIRNDSDALFRAIEQENPYAGEAKRNFFDAAHKLETRLTNSQGQDS